MCWRFFKLAFCTNIYADYESDTTAQQDFKVPSRMTYLLSPSFSTTHNTVIERAFTYSGYSLTIENTVCMSGLSAFARLMKDRLPSVPTIYRLTLPRTAIKLF